MKEEEGSRKSLIVKLKLPYTVVLESPSGSLNTQPAASANPTMASSVAAKTATKMISRRPSMHALDLLPGHPRALGFDFESTTVLVPSRTAVKYKIIKLQNMVIDAFHERLSGEAWLGKDLCRQRTALGFILHQGWATWNRMIFDELLATKNQGVAQGLKKSQLEGRVPDRRPASYYHIPDPKVEK
ncbi:uncharacterized protein RCO7_01478 [Rhynchosporium graminicola]|uniref:Uncharacterized protein n=1 Tax=Rhynchosporium graminicola TaxID=2792576 RepID=A0A1E1JZ91_9HELO|nr:uncharacterized protein RCO7_01478 [Rhynchosporium commune]